MSLMDTTPSLSNYTGGLTDLPDDAFLGQLLFFSISAADVNLINARQRLTDLGVSTDGLRKNLRPVDAFTKAAMEFAAKFKPVAGVRNELLARSAGEDTDFAYRHIMLERKLTQEGRARRLSYDKVAELVFTRGEKKDGVYNGHRVEGSVIEPNLDRLGEEGEVFLRGQLERFEGRYHHLLTHMDSHAVRTFVRNTIDTLSGTCVKQSGGLYFVPQKHKDEITKLGQWVNEIGSEFHAVPLLNLVEQRDMIMDAFQADVISELNRMTEDAKAILLDPERVIEPRTYEAMMARTFDLKARVDDYATMLGHQAQDATMEINIALAQIGQLEKRVRVPKRPMRATKVS